MRVEEMLPTKVAKEPPRQDIRPQDLLSLRPLHVLLPSSILLRDALHLFLAPASSSFGILRADAVVGRVALALLRLFELSP